VSFDRRVEEDRHIDGDQLPLFMSMALTTHQRVNVLPTNGINAPFGMLFKEGAADSALILGDSKKVLTQMPEGAFQSCVTSPPHWSLRNYNIPGQIGLELSLDSYIQNRIEVFAQVHRVLRDDGTLWLNIGDSHTSGGRTWRARTKKTPSVPWISDLRRLKA
jgi:DNA modification methylase